MPKSALGIPDMSRMIDIPDTFLQYWSYVLHKHEADNAGLHYDFRICDGKTAFSWVLKHGLPELGSRKPVLAIRQPDHEPDYMSFSGQIESGYGAGSVEIEDESPQIAIIKAGKTSVRVAFLHKSNAFEYLLVQIDGKRWQLQDVSPRFYDLELGKDKYKDENPAEIAEFLAGNYAFSRKIDGAHCAIDFDERITHIYSVRQSKRIDAAMQYTFHGPLETVKSIPELLNTRIHAEWFLVKDGKSISVNEISGILNSKPINAMEKIASNGYLVKFYMFDVDKYKGDDTKELAWADKISILRDISKITPEWFVVPEYYFNSEEKTELISLLESGKDPLTSEGVVSVDLDSNSAPVKIKFRPEFDVYVREIVGTVKGGKKVAGYFTWSWEPEGIIKGHVGTGFSDELRADMFANPDKYIGRVGVVTAMSKTDTGSLRAPSLKRFHTDK